MKNYSCNLQIINETVSYIQMKVEFKKPLFRIWFDVDMTRKNEVNQTQKLLSWKKFDICKFYSDTSSFPVIKDVIKYVDRKMNGMLHECPYSKAEIKNFTTSVTNNFDPQNSIIPNGLMKIELLIYNNRDKKIFFIKLKWRRHIIFKI